MFIVFALSNILYGKVTENSLLLHYIKYVSLREEVNTSLSLSIKIQLSGSPLQLNRD